MVLTLERRSQAALKVRDSRFVGIAVPVESEREARREIACIEAAYPDATHCCFAFRVGQGDSAVERSEDAGEPAGSAGAPILSVIKGRGLENLLVAVVRYFGGTKLGVGGLARAYRDAAKAAVEGGAVLEREPRRRLRVSTPLASVGEVRSLLARLGGEVHAESYGDAAEISLSIYESRVDELRDKLADLTRGLARIQDGDGEPA